MPEEDITMVDANHSRESMHNCMLDAIGMFDNFATEFQSESSDSETEVDFGIGPVSYDVTYDKVHKFKQEEENRNGKIRKIRAVSPQYKNFLALSRVVENEKVIGENIMRFEATLLYNKDGNEDSSVGNLPAGHRAAIRMTIHE